MFHRDRSSDRWNIGYDWVLRTPLEEGSLVIGYADDTLILVSNRNYRALINKLNLQISRVINHRIKQLQLNVAEDKTQIVIFNIKKKRINMDTNRIRHLQIRVGGVSVEAEDKMKYLALF